MRTAILVNTLLSALLLGGPCATYGQAQLALSDEDIRLLDLEFAPLSQSSNQAGISLPAMVIASPDQISQGITRYAGTIERWHAVAGTTVSRGEILASIRSPEILQLQQQFLEQDSAVITLRQQTERDRKLFDTGVISAQRLQVSEAQLRRGELSYRASREQLGNAGMNPQDIDALRNGDVAMGTGYVRAPADGSVAHRHYRTGEHVEANDVVVSLSTGDHSWLALQMPARMLPLLNEGSYLTLSDSDERLSLRQRDYAIDPGTQTVELLAEFDQPGVHPIGQVLRVQLYSGHQSVFVPAAAVVHEGDQTLVYVRNNQGVEIRDLELLPMGEGYLAAAGVRVGEQVLVRGAALVKGMQLGLGSDE